MSTAEGAIGVFSANGVKTIVGALVPRFEQQSGRRVSVTFGEAGEVRGHILAGEPFDAALLPAATLALLAQEGKILPDSIAAVASTDVGIAVRPGRDVRDAQSTEGLRRLLLAADKIVVTDPASGGVSGVHFAEILNRLAIADRVAPKLILTRGVFNAEFVARGEADLAVQLAHEIHLVAEVEFLPLPPELRRRIVFSVGLAAVGRDPVAAEFKAFLTGRDAAPLIAATGMHPSQPAGMG